MNFYKSILFALFVIYFCLSNAYGQTFLPNKSLRLADTISLPHVNGRIDHLAYDNQRQLIFVAAYKNNTVEVVDFKSKKIINTIGELRQPQGVLYIPQSNILFVTNGRNGECAVFNAETFKKKLSVQLDDDADAVRYDSIEQKIYVGYGSGGIAIIDAKIFKIIAQIKLSGHPESFQLDRSEKKIYVNVPDVHLIEVIDLVKNAVVDRWTLKEASSNFPMALDEVNHRLFIGCRFPAKLLVLDTKTGTLISTLEIEKDVDDIFYDSQSKCIYLSCGAGSVIEFKQINANRYKPEGNLHTQSGARTSLLIPEMHQLIVAAPSGVNGLAKLLIYDIVN